MIATFQHCTACGHLQQVDAHWRALYIDHSQRLVMTAPLLPEEINRQQNGAVFACGQGSALVLVERYLHCGSFEAAQTMIQQPTEQGELRP